MTVGIRSHPYQAQNAANMLQFGNMSAGKSPYVVDEQTVPQALYQPQMNSYKDFQPDFQNMDPLAYNQLYNSQSYPSYNTNFMAYPTIYQPDYNNTSSAMQGNEHATLRQNSFPHGSLDQFLPEFDYQQVLENLDLTPYENPELFCLEDYANLEQVNEGVNFDGAVKQEKADCDNTDCKNLEELENVLNNNILNANNTMVNVVTTDSPVSNIGGINNTVNINSTNDQTLDEQNLFDILEMYSSSDSVQWQSTSNYLPTGNQMVAGETIVKTEPNTNSCDFLLPGSPVSINTDEGLSAIGIPDEELIQMPVSRFNDLLLSLTPEQSNIAKDIRRKGKNKQAARLCRKRKIDNISALEGTLTQMEDEKSRLLNEQKEIIAETEELKSNIEMICEVLMKGLNGQNIALSELSLVHHSNGQTLVVQK
ncbi:Nuclear factor erythroid 2-related factor 1 [Paramuricea clavata]|uniref:Nuclear factor erythroid 2-related factor 1 n=1 Tax=Paramuricea clavata TaxID=317549 RepID=A0A6S7HTQ8_PARCT|nr:Nuclear factor erythroid 2-related factor 1 [Paramuricea clavata]